MTFEQALLRYQDQLRNQIKDNLGEIAELDYEALGRDLTTRMVLEAKNSVYTSILKTIETNPSMGKLKEYADNARLMQEQHQALLDADFGVRRAWLRTNPQKLFLDPQVSFLATVIRFEALLSAWVEVAHELGEIAGSSAST